MNGWLKIRVAVIYLLFAGFCGLVLFRLCQLQVVDNPELGALAKRQYEQRPRKMAKRVGIFDRNGEELAISVPSTSLFARPKLIARKRETSRKLAAILGDTAQKWNERLRTDRPFVWLARQIPDSVARRVEAAHIPGIFVEEENKRLYPNDRLASNLVGFTDIDGKGLSGLELMLNSDLTRLSSRGSGIRDGKGNLSYIDSRSARLSEDALGIYTTIDRRLQFVVEEALDEAMEKTGAKGVLAAVMDPRTGEIYALAQRPTFNPNGAGRAEMEYLANRWVSHLYEPGSLAKVFFAAKAMEEQLVNSQTMIDCGGGKITIGNRTINEADSHHRFSSLPVEKVIRYSSNVGSVRIAQLLGEKRMRRTLEDFGFTAKTGILLPGEAPLPTRNNWNPFLQATIGFGQGFSATPLHMLAAFAPFANGGFAVRPTIVMESKKSTVGKRVISARVAEEMKQILIGVTEDEKGTGRLAAIEGVKVAGKTGTAQKYDPQMGYGGDKYFSSFVGFLPADKPSLLIGVMVDEPKKDSYYASTTAAPLFKKIGMSALQILDVVPRQALASTRSPQEKSKPNALKKTADGVWIMPDVAGFSVRETMQLLGPVSRSIQVEGDGFVAQQSPSAGETITKETSVFLKLAPPNG